ncbi:hypothetical protein [Prevotella sp. OH937_COT-195]|uniref:hypothetical protein n=1 Tax=Prevotella sp. OH937_COT-195 TaxID=2491051 RepID=UPI000F651C4B|nr:hypothetical protein [Prevotella sp. OH937_COT-195]RRC99458.1 hypothetical protein EII32_08025 [Prevotella sp. OH937_COT-195]
MKKIYLFAVLACGIMVFANCTDGKNKEKKEGADSTGNELVEAKDGKKLSPMGTFAMGEGSALEDVDNIEYVLYPSSYSSAMEEGKDIKGKTSIYYKNTIADAGEKNTKLSGTDVRYPNNLLIPIYKDAKAKKGDIVLTWWQSGSGLQRAIVTDDSDPTQPKVHYLDLNFKGDGTGFAEDHDNEQLKPNSFVVLKDGEMQQGAPIVVNEDGEKEEGILVKADGDNVIYLAFASSLKETKKSNVKVIPLTPNYGVGDNVKGVFVGSFSKDYKVKKIDRKIGRVWLDDEGKEEILSILEVIK